MTHSSRAAALALSLLLFPVAAQCGSLSASSHALSRAISATVRASSHSLHDSSRASERAVALNEGDYRIVEVAEAPSQPEAQVRLTLVPLATQDTKEGVVLFLPAGQIASAEIRKDAIVSVKSRPYGVAISIQGAANPFALVLEDS